MALRIARSRLPLTPASRLVARTAPVFSRSYADAHEPITEDLIKAKLVDALKPSQIRVMDTSGGCGTFFNIDVVSKAFNGLSKVKQQRLVNEILKREVPGMHGLSMRTMPEEEGQ
ncbi:bola-like protein [Papiliotrema laurentii]|uniref:Bola-like protein n=1 Tax=Papiliotrema laurentii TaxID=5418 RepID=A0AAD9FRR2_PAPLA|nr:bola-like protein [Papiliotrema laurentii]